MNSIFDCRCSVFRNVTAKKNAMQVPVSEMLSKIQDGTFQAPILRLRGFLAKGDKTSYNQHKKQLQAVTFCGLFPARNRESLQQHTGFAIVDLDHVPDLPGTKAALCSDKHVAACFMSPSGEGLKALVRIPVIENDAQYKRVLPHLSDYYRKLYSIDIDWGKDGKDVCRLCFVSYDPHLYKNEQAEEFPIDPHTLIVPEPTPTPQPTFEAKSYPLAFGNNGNGNRTTKLREMWTQQAITTAQHIINTSTLGKRHEARIKASHLLGGVVAGFGEGILSENEARSLLLSVAENNTDNRTSAEKDIEDGLKHGQTEPLTTEDELRKYEANAELYRKGYHPRSTIVRKDELPALQYFEPSEYGDSLRFLDQYQELSRYNHTHEAWMLFDGQRWEPDEKAMTREMAKELLLQAERDARKIVKELEAHFQEKAGFEYATPKKRDLKYKAKLNKTKALKELIEKIDPLILPAMSTLRHTRNAKKALYRTVNLMLKNSMSAPAVSTIQTEYDENPFILNLQNGTLDLKTDTLLPHSPGHLLSKVAGTHYDPDATCPAFEKFLDMIFEGDTEVISYLQRAFGYSLTGLSDEKVLLFCYGAAGDNGKSTLFNSVKLVMQDYFTSAQAEILMESRKPAGGAQEGLANLKGARCVVTDEISGKSTIDIALVKRLTGADHAIKARFLYGHEFSFKPSHTLWMFGNEKPTISSTDNAIWNRVKLIPFEFSIPRDQQIPMEQVMATFQEEAPGILNWILQGWRVYRDEQKGLNIDVPTRIQVATQEYRDEYDIIKRFIEERCDTLVDLQEQNPRLTLQDIKEKRPELWKAFQLWRMQTEAPKIKQADFFEYLGKNGFQIEMGRARQYFVYGLQVKAEHQEPDENGVW